MKRAMRWSIYTQLNPSQISKSTSPLTDIILLLRSLSVIIIIESPFIFFPQNIEIDWNGGQIYFWKLQSNLELFWHVVTLKYDITLTTFLNCLKLACNLLYQYIAIMISSRLSCVKSEMVNFNARGNNYLTWHLEAHLDVCQVLSEADSYAIVLQTCALQPWLVDFGHWSKQWRFIGFWFVGQKWPFFGFRISVWAKLWIRQVYGKIYFYPGQCMYQAIITHHW